MNNPVSIYMTHFILIQRELGILLRILADILELEPDFNELFSNEGKA